MRVNGANAVSAVVSGPEMSPTAGGKTLPAKWTAQQRRQGAEPLSEFRFCGSWLRSRGVALISAWQIVANAQAGTSPWSSSRASARLIGASSCRSIAQAATSETTRSTPSDRKSPIPRRRPLPERHFRLGKPAPCGYPIARLYQSLKMTTTAQPASNQRRRRSCLSLRRQRRYLKQSCGRHGIVEPF